MKPKTQKAISYYRFKTIVFLIILSFCSSTIWGQVTSARLNTTVINQDSNFYSIQKMVYAYLNNLDGYEDGYYLKNGERQKINGYKQYKRWEWFWQFRINPLTGEFPEITAEDIRKELNYIPASRGFDSWTSLGPSTSDGGYHGIGRINCIAFRPGDNDVIYAGSPSGGLWKTTDGGSIARVETKHCCIRGCLRKSN